jgi:iron complex outermembrane receptor protein
MNQVHRLLAGTALALVVATPAFAQEADSGGGVEDIVVTAQRRDQSLQEVPIAVTAVTASTLADASITDTNALTALVPSMTSTPSVGNTAVFVRGVGTLAIATENSIGTYIDGVYMPSQFAAMLSLNNVERVEVLKGPQGTLFGRNATGGVINVITRNPGVDPTLNGSFSLGSYETTEASLYGSTPLAENLFVDLAVYYRDQGAGWGDNLTTGREFGYMNSLALRGKLIWEITPATTLTVTADDSEIESDYGMNFRQIPGSYGLDGSTYEGHFISRDNVQEYYINSASGVSAQLDHDFDAFRFVSISAYRDTTSEQYFDQDASSLPIVNGVPLMNYDETFTQEFQIQAPTGSAVQWILGAYYMDNKYGVDPVTLSGFAFAPTSVLEIYVDQHNTSAAVFGQATFEVLPNTNLTVGARYTEDNREVEGWTYADGTLVANAFQERSFDQLTYRLALDHAFSDDILGYVSYNRGFKSGTFNLVTYANPSVDPEILDAYEAGLKMELFGNHLRFNPSVFFYDYQDIQIQQVITGSVQISNAAAAELYGLDVDLEWAPTDQFSLTGGFIWMHGEYTEFPNAPGYAPVPDGPDLDSLPDGGNVSVAIPDGAGLQTVRTPEFSASLTASYTIPTSFGAFDLVGSYTYNSGYFWDPDNRVEQDAYDLLNASIQWTAPSERYYVRLFGRNVLDEEYLANGSDTNFGDIVVPAAPATFGVAVGFDLQ